MYGVRRSANHSISMRDTGGGGAAADAAWMPGYGTGADAVPAHPDLTAFWRLLPSASQETNEAGETVLTLAAGTRFPGPERMTMLLRRRCYGAMHRRICTALEEACGGGDGYRQFMAIGTPGTGKTGFLYDLLYELACAGKTVVLWRRRALRPLLFTPRGVFEASSLFAFEQELAEPETWFLCKGVEPPAVNALTVLAVSPGTLDITEFVKDRVMHLWVGPWRHSELAVARDAMHPALGDAALRRLYGRWGGVPRYVLAHASDPDQQRKLEDALAAVTSESVMAAAADILSAPEPFHRLMHIQVDHDCNRAGVAFGSPYICDRLCGRLEQQGGAGELEQLLGSWAAGVPDARPLRRAVFRRLALTALCGGGAFRVRDLSSPSAPLACEKVDDAAAAAGRHHRSSSSNSGHGSDHPDLRTQGTVGVRVVPQLELHRWAPEAGPSDAVPPEPALPPPGQARLVVLPAEPEEAEEPRWASPRSNFVSRSGFGSAELGWRCGCGAHRFDLAFDGWFVDGGTLHLIRVAADVAAAGDVAERHLGSISSWSGTGSETRSGSGSGASPNLNRAGEARLPVPVPALTGPQPDEEGAGGQPGEYAGSCLRHGDAGEGEARGGGSSGAGAEGDGGVPDGDGGGGGGLSDGDGDGIGGGGGDARGRCGGEAALQHLLPPHLRGLPRARYLLVPPAVFKQMVTPAVPKAEVQAGAGPAGQQQEGPNVDSAAVRPVTGSSRWAHSAIPLYALEVPLGVGASHPAPAWIS